MGFLRTPRKDAPPRGGHRPLTPRNLAQVARKATPKVGKYKAVGRASSVSSTASEGKIAVNLSFGNIEFQDMKSVGARGGGVRELYSNLRKATKQQAAFSDMLAAGQSDSIEYRRKELLATAIVRASGKKVKDDPTRINKALAKRRQKKRQSAKQWAERKRVIRDSVENAVENHKKIGQSKTAAKEKRKALKKGDIKAGTKGGMGGAGKGGKGGTSGGAKARKNGGGKSAGKKKAGGAKGGGGGKGGGKSSGGKGGGKGGKGGKGGGKGKR